MPNQHHHVKEFFEHFKKLSEVKVCNDFVFCFIFLGNDFVLGWGNKPTSFKFTHQICLNLRLKFV